MPHYLEPIIHPRSIAVIGASRDPFKRGHRVIQYLLEDGYTGQIFPINPKESEILGLRCYSSLNEVSGPIDLAFVCTPAASAPSVIEECGARGIKGALVVAGGFSEASEPGRVLEEEAVKAARRYGLRLIGPNTNGLFSARDGCNAYGRTGIPRGSLALLSNSANVLRSLEAELQFNGHGGISTMLSVGNQADILFHEYLEFLGEDPDTKAIVSYIEGFKDGVAYLRVARKVSIAKPIVVYTVGRNSEGKRAAKSHSGSLAADFAVTCGLLQQAGVVVVNRSDELLPVAEALTLFPPMRGRRVAVLSEGGGPISIAAEALAESGLALGRLTDETQAKIHKIVPNASAISNPVDAGGGTDPRVDYYGSISKLILADPNIDALLLVGYFGGYMLAPGRHGPAVQQKEESIAKDLARWMWEYGKPIMVQSHYGHLKTPALAVLREAGVPYQRHIETAVRCLAHAAEYAMMKSRLVEHQPAQVPTAGSRASEIIERARRARRDLLEPEARDLLHEHRAAMSPHLLVSAERDVGAAIDRFGNRPLAAKIVSQHILHKSEAGGVKLNIVGAQALREAFIEITAAARVYRPDAVIEGVLVTPMASRGVELIVGVTRTPQYGPVIMFGLGGVFVELVGDVTFRAPPLTRADAYEMIGSLRHARILDGTRGLPAVGRDALADLLLLVSRVAIQHPEIAQIDLNPVVANGDRCEIVDARIILTQE